jgi:hypothetical protein
MTHSRWLRLAWFGLLLGCGGSDDGGGGGSGDECPVSSTDGTLTLEIELDASAHADVSVLREGSPVGDAFRETGERMLSAGPYSLGVRRVRSAGQLAGPAFQGTLAGGSNLCVRAGKTTQARVVYTREPGSTKLWVTHTNGDGPQVLGFDADALSVPGTQTPSASASPKLENVGPVRVDGRGRLWVAANTGKLAGYAAARLGSNTTAAPDILIEGPSVCEDVIPCGPTALAFDAHGALWVATLHAS